MRAVIWLTMMTLVLRLDGLAAEEKAAGVASEKMEEAAIDLGGGVKLEMVRIRPGTYTMKGSMPNGADASHQVTLTKPYWIGKYELTQEQWWLVMGTNSAVKVNRAENPRTAMNGLGWADCQAFIEKLNQRVPGGGFRLPTEAEWEYACRAGSADDQCCGPDLDSYAWYSANNGYAIQPVGLKKPNAWGLYDTHGNVYEMCSDYFGYFSKQSVTDPQGPETGLRGNHVARGGGCYPFVTIHHSSGKSYERGIGHGEIGGAGPCALHGLRVARTAE